MELRIKIRPMEKEDLVKVGEIERLSFPFPWSVNFFSLELKKKGFAHYWVIELNEAVVGYTGYWEIKNEAHIVNLAIQPHCRKKGLGENLLVHILDDAQNKSLDIATLEVRKSNGAAQRLYEKFGFKKIAIQPHYYQDTNEDAFIYLKKLDKGRCNF
ncbi:ribosomal protein S18-alanine N-acetyltransferase [Patescibacteria group bacterium]|nr:ribosomal protein S18-alanine N-acetyltransferase [Patescibacteria group bacterium]